MATKFTHIRISEDTKGHLNKLRATGQSFEGLLRELIWLGYKYMRPINPVLPGDKMELERMKTEKMEPMGSSEMEMRPIRPVKPSE